MASAKRDFSDFKSFPGSVEDTGYYSLPMLYSVDVAQRVRVWQIHIRLVKPNKVESEVVSEKGWSIKEGWNPLKENQLPIKEEYFTDPMPENIRAQAWVETGIEAGKIMQSAPTYFTKPTNDGKANERNVFQCALIYARSQWLKRKDKGDQEKRPGRSSPATADKKLFPQLARPYKEIQHIHWPAYVQPKLDGVRCVAYLEKKNGGHKSVVAYSRTKKIFPSLDYLKKILYPYLNALHEDGHSIYLDGELYLHGKKLQEISGDSRNEDADQTAETRNQYHIYDCFYSHELETPFDQRHSQLLNMFEAMSDAALKVVRPVPTFLAANMKEATEKYKRFIREGYEGAMLRNADGPYAAGNSKTGTRSKDLIKLKPKFSDEFECVGFTEGAKGKDKGAVIWICQTKKPDGTFVRFNVTPKDMTYEQRYLMFKECQGYFQQRYEGRMLTVEYEDLSKDGVPQRAKALTFRDYE